MQHLLSVDDMKENYIFDLWSKAIDQKNNHSSALKNQVLTNLFIQGRTNIINTKVVQFRQINSFWYNIRINFQKIKNLTF